MPEVPVALLPLLLLAALAPAAASLHLPPTPPGGRAQALLPRHALADSSSSSSHDNYFDTSRLRRALRALLDLNDGELQALMAGAPPRTVAPSLSPSTAFFLTSSRQYLERLQTILATTREDTPLHTLTWNPKIARRRKKSRARQQHPTAEEAKSAPVATDDTDSILGALTELSAYLAGDEEGEEGLRQRRSHHGRKHKTLQARGSTQYEAHHYLYFLRSGECPRAPDGRPKMFCPTPTEDGQWICIEDEDLCDGVGQCPSGEDEAPTHCLFHTAMRTHLDELTKFVMLSKLT